MYKYFLFFTLLIGGTAFGQWTEPDTTACPQPGPGAQCPWISNDNLRLYISSMADIHIYSRPSPDSLWGPRVELPLHINSTPTQRCPAESPTGDTLYFVGDPRADCENYGSWDVYFTVRTGPCDTCWGSVQNAGANVSSNRREYSVGISRDGSMLLVASTRGQFVAPKLYWHEKQLDGTWGPANYFPEEINELNNGEEHACLSPDNNQLFFWHHGNMLGDIWVSEKVNGVWQQAVPLPSPPNNWPGVTYDQDPCLALDGRTLWFRKSLTDNYDYRIAVSVDTAMDAVLPRLGQSSNAQPGLFIESDSAENLMLLVEGRRVEGDHTMVVYDMLGRESGRYVVHFSRNGSISTGQLELPDLPNGAYILSLNVPNGTLSAKYIRTK